MEGLYKYSTIKRIINCTPKKYNNEVTESYPCVRVGYYHPSNANWSYQMYVIDTGKRLMPVVSLFGHIIAKGEF